MQLRIPAAEQRHLQWETLLTSINIVKIPPEAWPEAWLPGLDSVNFTTPTITGE